MASSRNTTRNVHVILDRELFTHVERHAQMLYAGTGTSPNLSAALRDLLRQATGIVANGYDAGWREGHAAAYAEAQARLSTTFAEVPSVPGTSK